MVVAVVVVAGRVRIPMEREVLKSLPLRSWLLLLSPVLPQPVQHLLRPPLPQGRRPGPLLPRERLPRQSRPQLQQQQRQQHRQLQLQHQPQSLLQLQNPSMEHPRMLRLLLLLPLLLLLLLPRLVPCLKEQRRAGLVYSRNLPLLHRNPSQLSLLLLRQLLPSPNLLLLRRKLPNLNLNPPNLPNLLPLLRLLPLL